MLGACTNRVAADVWSSGGAQQLGALTKQDMALFNRKHKKEETVASDVPGEEKKKTKRPANTAFKQQRLKAWQPILTPKTVLPTLFAIAIIFAPIGGLLIWGSGKVTQITLDYTECDAQAPTDGTMAPMPSGKWDYTLSTGKSDSINTPRWSFSQDESRPVGQQLQCVVEFDVPYDLTPAVFLYYKLTNYYQNHRRYVQSLDTSQLTGNYRSLSDIDGGNCKPVTSSEGKPYYPCGLIANSVFNDTFPSVTLLNTDNGAQNQTYNFTEKGIAWPNQKNNYVEKPKGYDSPSDVLPPPNWALRYPDGYTNETGFPDLRADEHFQVWMRTAALPTFRKLWARNDEETMTRGTYRVVANMNYPVKMFGGTKSIVISTVSWIGGKQPFLGWAYVAAAALCVLLGLAGTIRHLAKPRRLGDMSLLSWNQPAPSASR